MRFSLQREALLKPLTQVVNVVERRQMLPVLANFLVQVQGGQLSLTGTDLEVEMIARSAVDDAQDGETTIPARKLFEIVRALPDGSKVTVSQTGDKVTVQAGRSRFTLATLPANDFPSVDEVEATERVTVPEAALKELIERTAFAMAQQDVRYYLNGLLFDLGDKTLRCVATDGHRLAMCETTLEGAATAKRQIIVPRKGVTELQRLLEESDETVQLDIAASQVKLTFADIELVSKLVEGKFPDYTRVIPKGYKNDFTIGRDELLRSLQRAAIMTSDKFKGVRCIIEPGVMKISSTNADQEEAVEELEIDYGGDSIDIGFNVTYLLDVLNNLKCEYVNIALGDSNSSALISIPDNADFKYVVMPMRI